MIRLSFIDQPSVVEQSTLIYMTTSLYQVDFKYFSQSECRNRNHSIIICRALKQNRIDNNHNNNNNDNNLKFICQITKLIICQQKLNSIYSNVIICFIITPFLTLPYQSLLPSPLTLQNFTTPNQMDH